MPFGKDIDPHVGKKFSSENQPPNRGRKKDYFKQALEELAENDGQFPVAQNEIVGLVDLKIDSDGKPLITVKGEWAKVEGEETQQLALMIVQLPDSKSVAAQWYRDAKSRQANVRMRSRETLMERLYGKAAQPLSGDADKPLKVEHDFSGLSTEEKKQLLSLFLKAGIDENK